MTTEEIYYRGKGELFEIDEDGCPETVIKLPIDAEKIAQNFSVHVTPISKKSPSQRFNDSNFLQVVNVTSVQNNKFTVFGSPGEFYWIVYGELKSTQ